MEDDGESVNAEMMVTRIRKNVDGDDKRLQVASSYHTTTIMDIWYIIDERVGKNNDGRKV